MISARDTMEHCFEQRFSGHHLQRERYSYVALMAKRTDTAVVCRVIASKDALTRFSFVMGTELVLHLSKPVCYTRSRNAIESKGNFVFVSIQRRLFFALDNSPIRIRTGDVPACTNVKIEYILRPVISKVPQFPSAQQGKWSKMSNSKLRQRPSPSSTPKVASNDFQGSGGYPLSVTGPASSRRTRVHIWATSLAFSLALFLYLRSFIFHPSLLSYILCSPPGTTRIYTVDDNNTKVECLVVRDERIIDTGALSSSINLLSNLY
jgi:hypothetical protein